MRYCRLEKSGSQFVFNGESQFFSPLFFLGGIRDFCGRLHTLILVPAVLSRSASGWNGCGEKEGGNKSFPVAEEVCGNDPSDNLSNDLSDDLSNDLRNDP